METNVELDVFGQLPFLNLYTALSLIFTVPDEPVWPGVLLVDKLGLGLERLSKDIPWLGGKVTSKSSEDDTLGTFRIVSWKPVPQLFIQDLRDDASVPSLETLRQAKFPCSMIHEDKLAPYTMVQAGLAGSGAEPSPAFAVQASFIKGGVIITFVGHHQVMDMAGLGQLIRLVSAACRGEPFKTTDISAANLDRRNLIPLVSDPQSPAQNPTSGKRQQETEERPLPPRTCQWANISFSSSSLADIKAKATETLPKEAETAFISTDDALTAFIWQCISRARLGPSGGTDAAERKATMLTRTVDLRRYFDLPATYPGMIHSQVYDRSPSLEDVAAEPLGHIAARTRAAIQPGGKGAEELVRHARALATRITHASSPAERAGISFFDSGNGSTDVMISSWSSQDVYSLDFWEETIGLPEAVRRPVFEPPCEGLVYFLPKGRDGEIVVMLCLEEGDLERLKADEAVRRHGVWIG